MGLSERLDYHLLYIEFIFFVDKKLRYCYNLVSCPISIKIWRIVYMDNEFLKHKIIGSTDSLVTQIYRYLIELIENGLLKFGQQLPSEPDLAKQLNVSRFSLREALQRLELEGYIIKRRGIGTFVNKPSTQKLKFGFEKLNSLSGCLIADGLKPGIKELHITSEFGNEENRKKLNLTSGEKIYKIERLRTKKDQVFNWSIDYIAEKIIGKEIEKKNLGFSLYKYLEVHCGIFFSYSIAEIIPSTADTYLSEKLLIPQGSLLTKVSQIHYLENNDPIMLSIEYFPIDLFTISIIRRR